MCGLSASKVDRSAVNPRVDPPIRWGILAWPALCVKLPNPGSDDQPGGSGLPHEITKISREVTEDGRPLSDGPDRILQGFAKISGIGVDRFVFPGRIPSILQQSLCKNHHFTMHVMAFDSIPFFLLIFLMLCESTTSNLKHVDCTGVRSAIGTACAF